MVTAETAQSAFQLSSIFKNFASCLSANTSLAKLSHIVEYDNNRTRKYIPPVVEA
jgi:hypothetical protein